MTMEPGGKPDGLESLTDEPERIPDELEALLAGAPPRPAGGGSGSPMAKVLWTLAAVPGLALGLLLSMAIRVRLQDGTWPTRDQPDPKDLGIHNTVTLLAILASFVVVVLVPVLSLAAYFVGRDRRVPFTPPLVATAGLVALIIVLVGDLGGLGDWLAD